MKKNINTYKILRLLLCNKFLFVTCILFLAINSKAQQITLAAVSNPSGAPSEMKLTELKSVLMGEKQRWKNGDKIIIALMKTNTPLGKTTSLRIYDMTGDELNKYWLALVFQGKAQAPKFFSSANELENFVAQNPGAIGILDKPISDNDVKSVTIDGQKTF